jgi:hypothetical protein
LRLLADEKIATIAEIAQKNEKNNLLPALLLLSCYDAERNCGTLKPENSSLITGQGVKKTTL